MLLFLPKHTKVLVAFFSPGRATRVALVDGLWVVESGVIIKFEDPIVGVSPSFVFPPAIVEANSKATPPAFLAS